MKLTVLLMLLTLPSFSAPKRPAQNVPQKKPVVEQWLTKERRAQLEAITSRPYITRKQPVGKGMEELRWTNGSRSWVTTQAVTRITGEKAANGWQKKLDAKDAEKQALLDDLAKIKDKPTKKDLDAIINKHAR